MFTAEAQRRRVLAEELMLSVDEVNYRTGVIVDAAVKVHRFLGPGLLEKVYETCLDHELRRRGLSIQRQVPITLEYEDLRVAAGYKADLIVEGAILVEVKAREIMPPICDAQLLSYLKLAKIRVHRRGGEALSTRRDSAIFSAPQRLCGERQKQFSAAVLSVSAPLR
jgi:GxxExxY protein